MKAKTFEKKYGDIKKRLKKLRSYEVTQTCLCCWSEVWFSGEQKLNEALNALPDYGGDLEDELGIYHRDLVPSWHGEHRRGKYLDDNEVINLAHKVENFQRRKKEMEQNAGSAMKP